MTRILVVNSNTVHERLEGQLKEKYDCAFVREKNELTPKLLDEIQPKFVFFLHWSTLIPSSIYLNYECIVFHMTDLPYGRGGSPLQNLIVRGHKSTKMSALRVTDGLDEGDIYLKKELLLNGTAEEIFLRASRVIEKMIDVIVDLHPTPVPQDGEVTLFKRRTKKDGDLQNLQNLEDIYDFIRMLDSEGYPKAFLETDHFRLEFSRASQKKDKIVADVAFIRKY